LPPDLQRDVTRAAIADIGKRHHGNLASGLFSHFRDDGFHVLDRCRVEDAREVVDETARWWDRDLERTRERSALHRIEQGFVKIDQQYMHNTSPARHRHTALPVCLNGRMFAGRLRMHPTCPVCGHRFEREQGFFQGAMYVSWVLGVSYLACWTSGAALALCPASESRGQSPA